MSSLGDARRVSGRRRGGRRGIRGNSAKKNKSKNNKNIASCEAFFRARSDELVERTSVPRVFSRQPCREHQRNKAATARRDSLTSTLYVRQAAPVSITSQPMPRSRIAASSFVSGKRCRAPEPSTTISG